MPASSGWGYLWPPLIFRWSENFTLAQPGPSKIEPEDPSKIDGSLRSVSSAMGGNSLGRSEPSWPQPDSGDSAATRFPFGGPVDRSIQAPLRVFIRGIFEQCFIPGVSPLRDEVDECPRPVKVVGDAVAPVAPVLPRADVRLQESEETATTAHSHLAPVREVAVGWIGTEAFARGEWKVSNE